MLDKIIKRGQAKLAAQREAVDQETVKRRKACEALLKRLVPKAVQPYSSLEDYSNSGATIVIVLPHEHPIKRELSFTGERWEAVHNDTGNRSYWVVEDVPEDECAFDSLDMALARSLEK